MDFNKYQTKARSTAIYPNKNNNFVYPALGLAGESGEVCQLPKDKSLGFLEETCVN